MSPSKSNILLESGTGELEILKFKVKGVLYAINVIKVKEVLEVNHQEIEPLPSQPEAVRGMTNIRGEVITIIDLNCYLDCGTNANDKKDSSYMILTEFNNMKILFAVEEVLGINRLSWKDISQPNRLMGELVNGVIKQNKELISFLDFEKILTDVKPELAMTINAKDIDRANRQKRKKINLAIADDSPTIRGILQETLHTAGYVNLETFNDGEKLYNYLLEVKENNPDDSILDHVQGIISDIEMPQMDGHTLIKRINNDRYLRDLPTIIFSSLITKDLRHKGEAVGADEQISKPEIYRLIDLLDELILD